MAFNSRSPFSNEGSILLPSWNSFQFHRPPAPERASARRWVGFRLRHSNGPIFRWSADCHRGPAHRAGLACHRSTPRLSALEMPPGFKRSRSNRGPALRERFLLCDNHVMPAGSSKPRKPDFATAARRAALASGKGPDDAPLEGPHKGKNPAAAALARFSGAKGGTARAAKPSSEQRKGSARLAAAARWAGKPKLKH